MVPVRSAHATPIALKSIIRLQDYILDGGVAPYGARAALHSGSKHRVSAGKDQHRGEQGWDMAAGYQAQVVPLQVNSNQGQSNQRI